jgi:hypothetical protein
MEQKLISEVKGEELHKLLCLEHIGKSTLRDVVKTAKALTSIEHHTGDPGNPARILSPGTFYTALSQANQKIKTDNLSAYGHLEKAYIHAVSQNCQDEEKYLSAIKRRAERAIRKCEANPISKMSLGEYNRTYELYPGNTNPFLYFIGQHKELIVKINKRLNK